MDGPQADDDRETKSPACTTGDAKMDATYFFSCQRGAAASADAALARCDRKAPTLPRVYNLANRQAAEAGRLRDDLRCV